MKNFRLDIGGIRKRSILGGNMDFIGEKYRLMQLLHQWYLEATKNLDPKHYNPEAQKEFWKLSDEQRYIDEFIAGKVLKYLEERGLIK